MQLLDGYELEARAQAWAGEQPMFYGRDFEPLPSSLGLALSRVAGRYAYALCMGEAVPPLTGTDERGCEATVQYTYESYLGSLRAINADQEKRDDIDHTAALLKMYGENAAAIEAQLTTGKAPLLGEGRSGKVYPVELNGTTYAVKQGGVKYPDVRALRIGARFSHLSHTVGINYIAQRQVMELVPGKTLDALTNDERHAIPREHIEAAMRLIIGITDAGLKLDGNPRNFMYDPATGFHFIDYRYDQYATKNSNFDVACQLLDFYDALLPRFDQNTPRYGTRAYTEWCVSAEQETQIIQNQFVDALENTPEALDQLIRYQASANSHEMPAHRKSVFYTAPDDECMRFATSGVRAKAAALRTRLTRLGLIGEADIHR